MFLRSSQKKTEKFLGTKYQNIKIITWIAVRAATMAGDPNPWDINEKCVKCLWIDGSRINWGRVLQSGDLSWFKRSINSFVTYINEMQLINWLIKYFFFFFFNYLFCVK